MARVWGVIGFVLVAMVPGRAQDSQALQPTRSVIEAAARGEAYALHVLGLSIESVDSFYAAQLFFRAAQLGYRPADVRLAYLLHSGALGVRDVSSAITRLERAAEAGVVEALVMLAAMHFAGSGVEANVVQGRRWLAKAAAAGHQESQFDLGVMLMKGLGGERNEFAARRWFKLAADGPEGAVSGKARDLVRDLDPQLLDSSAAFPDGLLKFFGAALLVAGAANALLPNSPASRGDGQVDAYLQKLQKRNDNAFVCTVQVGGWSSRTAAAYNTCCALRGGC